MKHSYHITLRRLLIHLTRIILLMMAISVAHPVFAQSYGDKNKVILIGQVTRLDNGAPIENHEVVISADTTYEPHFIYTKKLLTDHEGFYYDTIKFEGEKGALYIKTYDYYEKLHDTTVYFRFTWSADNILFADFALNDEPIPTSYQANFLYERDSPSQGSLTFQFTDITNSSEVISWSWDFGDGTYSSQQNPVHTYESTGLFRVKLTVKIKSSQTHNPIMSTIVKIVNVYNKGYFHLGGMVMAGYFPIDFGEAILYKIENDTLVSIDTSYYSDEYGFYYFYQLIEGDYIVMARLLPKSSMFNDYFDTYFGDKIHWGDSDTVYHHATSFNYDITLIPVPEAMSGPGEISGLITYGYDPGNAKAIPAENVEIILFDKNDNTRQICHSNKNGVFSLEWLDLQMYYIYAEVPGKHTFPLQISIDEYNPEINYVKITIGSYGVNGSISSGVSELSTAYHIGDIYPNPAHSSINIDIESIRSENMHYDVFSSNGKLLGEEAFSSQKGMNQLSVDIGSFEAGNYFLRITDEHERITIRKFVKR